MTLQEIIRRLEKENKALKKRVSELDDAWFVDEQIQKDGSLRPSIYDTVRRARKAESDLARCKKRLEKVLTMPKAEGE